MLDIYRGVRQQFQSYRRITVTEQTLFPAGSEIRCPVRMAIQAGDIFHPRTMNYFPFVTLQTEPLFSGKFMNDISVALCAFDLLHEIMLGMAP
jgi:hypothetical protein